MTELEAQQRRDTIYRQQEDLIMPNATSSACTAQALRAMSPPPNRAQQVQLFHTRSDNNNNIQQAQDDLNTSGGSSIRTHVSRIGAANDTVKTTLDTIIDDCLSNTAGSDRSQSIPKEPPP